MKIKAGDSVIIKHTFSAYPDLSDVMINSRGTVQRVSPNGYWCVVRLYGGGKEYVIDSDHLVKVDLTERAIDAAEALYHAANLAFNDTGSIGNQLSMSEHTHENLGAALLNYKKAFK